MTDDRSAVAVAPYDHLRTDGSGDAPAGVYRVVGSTPDAVTLLRVADADGARRHTGSLRHVDRGTVERRFAPAPDPDPRVDVRGLVDGLRWFPRAVLDRFR